MESMIYSYIYIRSSFSYYSYYWEILFLFHSESCFQYFIISFYSFDLPYLTTLEVKSYVFYSLPSFIISQSNLSSLTTFKTHDYAFYSTEIFKCLDHSKLATIETGDYSFHSTTTLQFTNLTSLTSFIAGPNSFINVETLELKGILLFLILNRSYCFGYYYHSSSFFLLHYQYYHW